MSYTTEKDLKQKVDMMIYGKIKPLLETKIKQQMIEEKNKKQIIDTKVYVFENEKYYLKKDIDRDQDSQLKIITQIFSDQIQSSIVDLKKINSTRDIYGRETQGQRRFNQEKIEEYVDDLITTITF